MLPISKNKFIVCATIVFTLGIFSIKNFIPANIQQINNQIIENNNNAHFQNSITVYEQIKQELKKQEQDAWNLLQTDTNVSKEECLEKQKKNYSMYKRLQKQGQQKKRLHYPKLKEKTVNLVQDIICDLGLNPTDIQILPYNGQGSPAAADDSSICIDEKELERYTADACHFFIAHEVAHLQAQDQSLHDVMRSLINRKKISNQKKKNAINSFRRFQEIRADMQAILHGGEKYACGAFKFFTKLQELDGGDNPGITHPKTSKRIEIAQDICSKVGWNVENMA